MSTNWILGGIFVVIVIIVGLVMWKYLQVQVPPEESYVPKTVEIQHPAQTATSTNATSSY